MTEPPPFDPAAHGWSRLDETGYSELIGPLWRRVEDDDALHGLLAASAHLNRNGTVHGGVLLGLTDHALGHVSGRANDGARQATTQLDMQFLAAAREGDFVVVRGTVMRRTRSLMFMRGEVSVGDRTIAVASGIWKILGAP